MKSDQELLGTPFKELTREEIPCAFAASERAIAKIAAENKKHKSNLNGKLQVITDAVEVYSPADGKVYTSKSRYYQTLKDSGNHVIERGENYGKNRQTQGDFNVKQELKQAIERHL